MKTANRVAGNGIRYVGLAGSLVTALRIIYATFRHAFASFIWTPWYAVGIELLLGLISLSVAGSFVWLAFKLWLHWDALALRWLIGIAMAIGLVWTDMITTNYIAQGFPSRNADISSLLAVPLIVVGGGLYKYVCRKLVRVTGLVEILDIYGRPAGHQARIKMFAGLLSWAIFLTGGPIERFGNFSKRPDSWQELAVVLGPILLGGTTYKLIIWFAKPRARPALPAGGFEVITNPPPVANGTTDLA
jgi:hypothetical protein